MPNYVFRSRLAVKRGKTRGKNVNRIARSRAVKSPHWKYGGHGYIAGEGTGIVTVGGQPLRAVFICLPGLICTASPILGARKTAATASTGSRETRSI